MSQESIYQSRITKLIRNYVRIAMVLVLFIPTTMTLFSFSQNTNQIKEELASNNQFVFNQLVQLDSKNKNIAYNLLETENKRNSLMNYFNQSYSEYATRYLMGEEEFYFPNEVNYLYSQDSDLMGVHISLQNSSVNYHSERDKRYGRKAEEIQEIDGIRFSLPLYYSTRTQQIGTISFYYSPNIIMNDSLSEIQTLLINPTTNQPFYPSEGINSKLIDAVNQQDYIAGYAYSARDISGLARIVSYIPTKNIWARTSALGLAVFFISIIIALGLYYIQRRLFSQYTRQVNGLVYSLQRIGDGEFSERIDVSDKEDEIYLISNEINRMLDEEQKHVNEIYSLRLKQQEVYIKAIQAQINPHFFYNTLEFFRMTALIEGVDELADMIFDFSSLMRNSIDQRMESDLQTELSFCRKYLHLYQKRYPDKLKVELELDPQLEDVKVPKFTLQPLVENYIVHGVDWSRKDNEIKVKVWREPDRPELIQMNVSDNGLGMSEEEFIQINEKLRKKETDQTLFQSNSLGVEIVYQQLIHYFGKQTKLSYQPSTQGGVLVCIQIPYKKE